MVGVEEKERSLDLGSAGSFSYSSYGEGVVKLFIALCEEAQRIYGDALSGLTLREFQDELVKRIPEGSFAIEDLVSTFEAVSYGGVEPSEKEFEIYEASVERARNVKMISYACKDSRARALGNIVAFR